MLKRYFRKALSNHYSSKIMDYATRCTGKVVDFVKANPVLMMMIGLVLLQVGDAFAWSTPTTGSFAYDVYDIAVNKILNGPIGFVVGMGAMAAGGAAIVDKTRGGWGIGIPMLLFGGALIKLDSIVTTLGMYI